MRVPVISTDATLFDELARICRTDRDAAGIEEGSLGGALWFDPTWVGASQAAIEYITYQMPALVVVDFSDPRIEPFDLMGRVASDPWLNNGGVLAIYDRAQDGERIDELPHCNLLISLQRHDVQRQLPTVLRVIRENQQILFQRVMQSDLLSTITGFFTLGMDLRLVPCYANLIANYLYNMAFVDEAEKARTALVLTEMLTNAIEHGSCEITFADKTRHLDAGGKIHDLIARRAAQQGFARRTVFFGYEIERSQSTFVIRDEGPGFDWRRYLKTVEQGDVLSLHGRGILLTVGSVAQIGYNERGNEVTLRVDHRENMTNVLPSAFKNSEIVPVQPGEVVFRQGEESSFIYYMAEGEYRVVVNEREISTLNPTDILIGEMSFLLEERRSATVIAKTSGRLIKISKEDFINGIKAQPYYALFLAKLLAQRIQRRDQQT